MTDTVSIIMRWAKIGFGILMLVGAAFASVLMCGGLGVLACVCGAVAGAVLHSFIQSGRTTVIVQTLPSGDVNGTGDPASTSVDDQATAATAGRS